MGWEWSWTLCPCAVSAWYWRPALRVPLFKKCPTSPAKRQFHHVTVSLEAETGRTLANSTRWKQNKTKPKTVVLCSIKELLKQTNKKDKRQVYYWSVTVDLWKKNNKKHYCFIGELLRKDQSFMSLLHGGNCFLKANFFILLLGNLWKMLDSKQGGRDGCQVPHNYPPRTCGSALKFCRIKIVRSMLCSWTCVLSQVACQICKKESRGWKCHAGTRDKQLVIPALAFNKGRNVCMCVCVYVCI